MRPRDFATARARTASVMAAAALALLSCSVWAQAQGSSLPLDDRPATEGDNAVVAPPRTGHYEQVADARGLGGVVGYGRGAAFVDIDGDGDDDLFVADTDGRLNRAAYGMSMFYLNDGTGHFEPAQLPLDPVDFRGTWVGSFADYDNDGDPDLMVGNGGYTNRSSLVLFENRIDLGHGLVNVTRPAGLKDHEFSQWWGVAWADYDNDGWLDVIATRRAGRPLLFHNDQDGSFSEQGVVLGIFVSGNRDTKNPVWIDYDEDGDQDLYVAGIDWHAFYRNDAGIFEDITDVIFAEPLAGRSDAPLVFAAATADFDQDGHEDLYLGRWDSQDYILFSDGKGNFERLGLAAGLDTRNDFYNELGALRWIARARPADLSSVPPYENTMGLGIGDLFDDGFPDVVIGTGDGAIAAADVIFCNRGRRLFERCTDLFTEPNEEHRLTRGHGAVFADIDKDGFTDFFFNLGGHPEYDHDQQTDSREVNKLFVRRTDKPANAAWLTLRGTKSNRDAIGARITYGEGDLQRYHYVHANMGFQSQNSATLLLPLGGQESAPVTIDWPSGASTKLFVRAGELTHAVEEPTP